MSYTKTLITASFLLSSSIGFAQEGENLLDTDESKYSYAVGNQIGQQLMLQFSNPDLGIDMAVLKEALNSVLDGEDSLMTEDEIRSAIENNQLKQLEMATKQAEEKIQEGEDYRNENRQKPGVNETESGIQYTVIESGDGEVNPTASDTVVVHYSGKLINGTEFDSSYSRNQPAEFSLGAIIPGWNEILQMMKAGDKWSVVIPPELAYGERGAGNSIGPNETLIFEIHLLEIK